MEDKEENLVPLGLVIIHWEGTNPYRYSRECGVIGETRSSVLRDFRDRGGLPDGVVLWDDRNKRPITSPDQIDWTGLR